MAQAGRPSKTLFQACDASFSNVYTRNNLDLQSPNDGTNEKHNVALNIKPSSFPETQSAPQMGIFFCLPPKAKNVFVDMVD